jgi:heme/copper-type cytochrome/quinol oxidase subunit 4
MSLSDAAWIFTGVVFAVIVGCTIWVIKEERRK